MPTSAHYGHRARLGLIVPPNNTVTESEWAAAVPEGVTVHALRFRLNPLARSPQELDLLRAGLRLLAAQSPKALAAALGRLEPVKLGRPRQQG
jgi:maleate cis-trans isomerase